MLIIEMDTGLIKGLVYGEEEVVGRIRVSSVIGSALAIINDRKNGS